MNTSGNKNKCNKNKDTCFDLIKDFFTNRKSMKFFLFMALYFLFVHERTADYSPGFFIASAALSIIIAILTTTAIIFDIVILSKNLPKNSYGYTIIIICIAAFTMGVILIENYLQNVNLPEKQNISSELKTDVSKTEKNTSTSDLPKQFESEPSKPISKDEDKDKYLESKENLLRTALKYMSKLLELVAIGALVGFIGSYHSEKSEDTSEKSESKNEQADNTTENNQTDAAKPEPQQSSEGKESP